MASVHSGPGEIPDTQYFVPEQRGKNLSPFHPIHSYKSTCILKKKKNIKFTHGSQSWSAPNPPPPTPSGCHF